MSHVPDSFESTQPFDRCGDTPICDPSSAIFRQLPGNTYPFLLPLPLEAEQTEQKSRRSRSSRRCQSLSASELLHETRFSHGSLTALISSDSNLFGQQIHNVSTNSSPASSTLSGPSHNVLHRGRCSLGPSTARPPYGEIGLTDP